MQHAKLSPSSAEKWMNCPGSISAEQNYISKYGEKPAGVYAEEGTNAHTLGETCLNNGTDPEFYVGNVISGKPVTDNMAEAVQQYVDYVRAIPGMLSVETKVNLTKYIPEGFGTCDAYIVDDTTLHVIDYKHGMGVKVSADNNSQMKLYALGLLQVLPDIETVILHIVQPRTKNFSKWITSAKELKIFGEEVKIKAAKALNPKSPRIPSEKACQWCKAKSTCPELVKLSESLIAMDFDNLDEEGILFILDNEKTIISHIEAVKEHALLHVPKGYKLSTGRTIRKWSDEKKVVVLLGEAAYEKKLISPTQAMKLKVIPAELESLIVKPEGKQILVKDDSLSSF